MKQTERNYRKLSRLLGALSVLVLMLAAAAPANAHRRVRPHRHVIVRPSIVIGTPAPVKRVVLVAGKPAAVIDFNVQPKATRIFIDGSYRGTCAEYDGHPQKMHLSPGLHRIRLVTPDGVEITRKVDLVTGYEVNINLDL